MDLTTIAMAVGFWLTACIAALPLRGSRPRVAASGRTGNPPLVTRVRR